MKVVVDGQELNVCSIDFVNRLVEVEGSIYVPFSKVEAEKITVRPIELFNDKNDFRKYLDLEIPSEDLELLDGYPSEAVAVTQMYVNRIKALKTVEVTLHESILSSAVI